MRMYLSDGTYWQTLVKPTPPPSAIGIGPYIFIHKGDYYQALASADQPPQEVYTGPVSYMGELDVEPLPNG